MDDRLHDPGNPDFRPFSCAAWVYFTTWDKILPFFADAIHEAIENNVSIPDNHVAADEVPVAVGYVFFRQPPARYAIFFFLSEISDVISSLRRILYKYQS